MADFVPKNTIDSSAPNWTGASSKPDKTAYQPNKSFEVLFSGLGQAIGGAANAAYTGIVDKIKDDWHGQLEPVRDAQGVGDLTDAATVGLKHPAGSPPQMTSFEERATKLAQAHAEGRIDPTYYYAQLNAMSKEMRAKYPGFRDEVDAIIQKTTGVVPANALRNAVLAKLEATRTAQDKEADRSRTYALQNEKHWTPAMRERMQATGQLPTIQELSPVVAENEGRERLVQSARAQMELDEQQGKAVAGRAVDQFHTESRDLQSRVFAEAVKKLDSAVGSTLAKGQAMGAGELQQVTGAVAALEMEINNSIDRILNGVPEGRSKSLAQLINDSDKVRKMREDALAPVARIKEAIANNNFGLAHANARALAAMKDQKARQLIERYDHLANIAGLAKVGGEQFLPQLMATDGGAKVVSDIIGTVRDVFTVKIAGGSGNLPEAVAELGRHGATEKDYLAYSRHIIQLIANPDTPPKVRENLVKGVFSQPLPFKQRDKAYRLFGSPEVSKQMIAVKDTQPEVFKQYQDWMMNTFFKVHKQLGDNVNAIAETQTFSAKFNPATNQFELGLTDVGMREVRLYTRTPLADPMKTARQHIPGASGLIDAVNEMNKNIKVLEPVMKATGMDVGKEMDRLFKIQGVMPDAPKKRGWLGMLRDGVKSVTDEVAGEVKKEVEAVSNFFGGSELNFQQASGGNAQGTGSQASLTSAISDQRAKGLLDAIAGHESGNNYDRAYGRTKTPKPLTQMTVSEVLAFQANQRAVGAKSTAMGKYQIIYGTLKGLVKELGLKGDERFDDELQDRLGLALLKRRGWDRFAEGKMTREQFMDSLAEEWAALPTNATGLSYYAGDGLNRNLVSRDDWRKTIDDVMKQQSSDADLPAGGAQDSQFVAPSKATDSKADMAAFIDNVLVGDNREELGQKNYGEPVGAYMADGAKLAQTQNQINDVFQRAVTTGKVEGGELKSLTNAQRQQLDEAHGMIKGSAVASIGFDPKVLLVTKENKPGRVGGVYGFFADGKIVSPLSLPETILHESVHRGIDKVKAKARKGDREALALYLGTDDSISKFLKHPATYATLDEDLKEMGYKGDELERARNSVLETMRSHDHLVTYALALMHDNRPPEQTLDDKGKHVEGGQPNLFKRLAAEWLVQMGGHEVIRRWEDYAANKMVETSVKKAR